MVSADDINQVLTQTILIVDDHDALRASLQRWLKTVFPDYGFLEAKSGEEALTVACEQKPKIVIMDFKLPDINGIEATRRIKKAFPGILVIMLSMYDASEYRSASESAGASAYVPKHKMYTELISVLDKFMPG